MTQDTHYNYNDFAGVCINFLWLPDLV